jgi:nucleotide-binding universal stress UspA family protein
MDIIRDTPTMYELLVPVDRNEERAEAQVGAVVDAPYDADELLARILHVVEDVDTPFSGTGPDYASALEEEVADLDRLPGTVSTVAERLRGAGIETRAHSTRGVPTDAILEVVEATDADAVVIGCRRRTPVGKVVFGSVAQEVIRRAECPIVVTPR